MRNADEQEKSAFDSPARAITDPDFGARYALKENAQRLLDCYGLREVARLVYVRSTLHRDVVREQLKRDAG